MASLGEETTISEVKQVSDSLFTASLGVLGDFSSDSVHGWHCRGHPDIEEITSSKVLHRLDLSNIRCSL